MTESSRAVFLSYASQDAPAARRICEALRAAGVEVWFDQSALRGGDAWDAAIRRQIKNCALFMPIISRNTHQREEGYFRLEWKLAVDRSHLMTTNRTFLLPIAIDDVGDDEEHVPDRFRELQWTRLPGGEASPAFVERVVRLLAHDDHASPTAQPTAHPGARAIAPQPAAPHAAQRRISPTALVILAVVVIALGYPLIERLTQRAPAAGGGNATPTSAQPASSAGAAPEATPQKSIAVLPFVNMSADRNQEYFSDGLTEELIDLLSQVPDLRVPARTSSFYFKGKSEDIATIAGKLRVANVLEGSVRRSGNTMRVTAQLIRADNGYHLWSKTYDRDVRDIFKVQDEIAATVVEALKAKLLPAQEITSRHRTTNSEAYAEYLLGNQFRARDTPDANQQALASYRRAVALDPDYAAAYSGLSEAEWRVADQSTAEAAGFQRAAAAADKAIALAPDSPEGYWARGQLRNYHDFDWDGAHADYQRALQLDPNDVRSLVSEGALLATLGRMQESEAMLLKAIALDPLSTPARRTLIQLQIHTGELAVARASIQRLVELDPRPDPAAFAEVDLLSGHAREALAAGQNGNGNLRFMYVAMAQHTLGHDAESQRALDVLITRYAGTLAYQIAEVYAWQGEYDKTFEWLERAYRQRDGGMGYLPYDRYLAPLHADPRFRALLSKLKLPGG